MTLTFEVTGELAEMIEADAKARGTSRETIALEAIANTYQEHALQSKAFDESHYGALLQSDPLAALDYVINRTPNRRAAAGFPPLTDEQVSRSAYYED
jgi:hypothetical protein